MIAIYRVYTEHRDNLPVIVARHFDGATLFPATGLYRGLTERACIIEILGGPFELPRVTALAEDIQQTNAQSLVIVTRQTALTLSRVDVSEYESKVSA